MSFAKVTIVGNLGRDPESRYLQSGTLVVSFSMAAQGRRRGGEQPRTTWFNVSAFGEQAERLANMVERGYIAKGRLLYVEGQLEERPYTDRDGNQRTSLDVNLSDWQFVGGGRDEQQGGGGQNNAGNQGGHRISENQDTGGGYGGSDYGDQYSSGDDQSDMNDVPF